MVDGGPKHTHPPLAPERIYVVGASFRTADSKLRDRLYVEDSALPEFLSAASHRGLSQLLMLSTCDRVEMFGAATEAEVACREAEAVLRKRLHGMTIPDRALYRLFDTDAVRHVFRIAAALDSQMVGEPQILGQLKTAAQCATDAGLVHGEMDRLTQAGFALAKRVRSTTRIGEGAVSAAAAAVKVASDLHGDLARCRALLIGLSETGALIIEQFRRAGIGVVDLTGPARRTEREAARRGLMYQNFDRLADILPLADVVITAAGQGRYILDRNDMAIAIETRRSKPILIVDTGIPSDVDPAVDSLDDAFLFTLEDVERLAEKGQFDRKAEAEEAEAMVENAVLDWRRSQAEREGVPGLVALRDRFEAIRHEVLTRHPNADAQEATRLVINRLLHDPSEALRQIAAEGDSTDLRDTITVNRVLERLFGLSGLDKEKHQQ